MGQVSRKRIGFLSGNPQATTVNFVVASFTDAAITVNAYTTSARTGSPVATKTINASSGASPKLAKYPSTEDRGTPDGAGELFVCWVGTSSLTGLTAGTRYYLTLTQGAVTESDCSTATAPAAGGDFQVFFISCDLGYECDSGPGRTEPPPATGSWPILQDYAQRYSGLSFGVFIDDVGYTDMEGADMAKAVNDATLGKSHTGPKTYLSGKAYDYALSYLALLGMLEDTSSPQTAHGRDEYRSWGLRNLPWQFSWGDHEFQNEILTAGFNAQTFPNYALGKTAFFELFGKLWPTPAINLVDTTALPWALTLGDLRMVSVDSVSRWYITDTTVYPHEGVSVLGNNQISDVLTALNTSAAFKVLVMPATGERSWRTSMGTLSGETNAQQPLAELMPAEWTRLFHTVDATPKSIMDNTATNGSTGVLFVVHGDVHLPQVQRSYGHDNDDGVTGTGLRADWMSFTIATVNRHLKPQRADTIDKMNERWHRARELMDRPKVIQPTGTTDAQLFEPCVGLLTVYGSRSPKECRFRMLIGSDKYSSSWQERFEARFRVGSNRPYNWMCADQGISHDIY